MNRVQMKKLLTSPLWQGIGGIVGILALLIAGFGIYSYFVPHLTSQSQEPDVTATAKASQDLYFKKTLADSIGDPLSLNKASFNWDENKYCVFKDGRYHALNPDWYGFRSCMAKNTNYSDLIFQVQMTISKGSYGGILFRYDDSIISGYSFRIGQDAVWSLGVYKAGTITELKHGPTPSFKQGTNIITVIAQGSHFIFYVNLQYLNDTNDATFNTGRIGFIAGNLGSPTDVAYDSVRVWDLKS
jgi:hypothetical protein